MANNTPWILYLFVAIAYLIRGVFFVLALPSLLVSYCLLPKLKDVDSVEPSNVPKILVRFLIAMCCIVGFFSPVLLAASVYIFIPSIAGTSLGVSLIVLPLASPFLGRCFCQKWITSLFNKEQSESEPSTSDAYLGLFLALSDPFMLILILVNTFLLLRLRALVQRLNVSPSNKHWRSDVLLTLVEFPLVFLCIPLVFLLFITVLKFNVSLFFGLFEVHKEGSFFDFFLMLVGLVVQVLVGIGLIVFSCISHVIAPHRIPILLQSASSLKQELDDEPFFDLFVKVFVASSIEGWLDLPAIIVSIPVLFSWRSPSFISNCFFKEIPKNTPIALFRRGLAFTFFINLILDILVFPFTVLNLVTIYRFPRLLRISNKSDCFHAAMVHGFFYLVADILIFPLTVFCLLTWKSLSVFNQWKICREKFQFSTSLTDLSDAEQTFGGFVIINFFTVFFDVITAVCGCIVIIPTVYRITTTVLILKRNVTRWNTVVWKQIFTIFMEIPIIAMGALVCVTWRSFSLLYQLFVPTQSKYHQNELTSDYRELDSDQPSLCSYVAAKQRYSFVISHFFHLFIDILSFPSLLFVTLTVYRLPIVFKTAAETHGDSARYFGGWLGWHLPSLKQSFSSILDLPFIILGLPAILSWRRKALFERVTEAPTSMKARLAILLELYYFFLDLPAFFLIALVFITRWRWPEMVLAIAEGKCAVEQIDSDERSVKFTSRFHSCVYHEAFLWFTDIIIFFFSIPLKLSCWRGVLVREIFLEEGEMTEGERKVLIAKQFGLLLLDLPMLFTLILTCVVAPWRIMPLIRDIKATTLRQGIHSPVIRQFYEAMLDLPHVYLLFPLCLWRIPVTVKRGLYDDKFAMSASSRRVLVWKQVSYMFMDIVAIPPFVFCCIFPWRWPFLFKAVKTYERGTSEHKLALLEFSYCLMDFPVVIVGLVSVTRWPFFFTRLISTEMSGYDRRKSIFRLFGLTLCDLLHLPFGLIVLVTWRSFSAGIQISKVFTDISTTCSLLSTKDTAFIDYSVSRIYKIIIYGFSRIFYDVILFVECLLTLPVFLSWNQLLSILKAFFVQYKPEIKRGHCHTTEIFKLFIYDPIPISFCPRCNLNSYDVFTKFTFVHADSVGNGVSPYIIDSNVAKILELGLERSIHFHLWDSLCKFVDIVLIPLKVVSLLLTLITTVAMNLLINSKPFIFGHFFNRYYRFCLEYFRFHLTFYSMERVFFISISVVILIVMQLVIAFMSFIFTIAFFICTFGLAFKAKSIVQNCFQNSRQSEFGLAILAIIVILMNIFYFSSHILIVVLSYLFFPITTVPYVLLGFPALILHFFRMEEVFDQSWGQLTGLAWIIVSSMVVSTGKSFLQVLSLVLGWGFQIIFSLIGQVIYFFVYLPLMVAFNLYQLALGVPVYLSYLAGCFGQLTVTVVVVVFVFFPWYVLRNFDFMLVGALIFVLVVVNIFATLFLVPQNWKSEPVFNQILKDSFVHPRKFLLPFMFEMS
ncbi:hypothetical protein GEMRC1_003143 [Eukaryota sp. GEM-RC1]